MPSKSRAAREPHAKVRASFQLSSLPVLQRVKVTPKGFQPRMAEALANDFPLRLLDMDRDNIGREKFGVMVEAPERSDDAVDWLESATGMQGRQVTLYESLVQQACAGSRRWWE